MPFSKYIIVALISISLIAIELVWTRIFSAEFFYTFAFLILSLAILGLGMGALSVRLFSFLNRITNMGIILSITAVMILIGPALVFKLELDFSQLVVSYTMLLKIFATIFLLSSSFFCGGIALALIFKRNSNEIPRLYMADLSGAAIGVFLIMLAMNLFGTPVSVFLSALPILSAAFLSSKNWWKILPLFVTIGMLFLSYFAEPLLEATREEPAPVIYKHWDAISKVKIYDYGEQYRRINIDNVSNSFVNGFDGNWDRPDSLKFGFHLVEFIINQFDSCTFLSLGAGGGQDVFQALQANANEIHAVEVNPHVNDLMLSGILAEFSGYIYRDPRVRVITEDARAYVRRFENKFDFIYSFSSNTYAALASGAFALAENYIYTSQAIKEYWNALTDNGYLLMEHHMYVPRIVSQVMDALDQLDVKNGKQHFVVYNLPNMRRKMLLLCKRPMTEKFAEEAFGDIIKKDPGYGYLIYPAPDSLKSNLINQIVQHSWDHAAASAAVDISPCSDDRPFPAQMGLWKNFDREKLKNIKGYEDLLGFPLSKIIIMVILAIVVIIIIPLNLLPYLKKGNKMRAIPWLYFFTIGMAFMMVEIILIQRYTLFIGPSVYSIITILLVLLLSSGIGSFYAPRINKNIVFPAIVFWIFLEIFVLRNVTYALGNMQLIPRMLLTAILVSPLGFFMGMPFPKGGLKVGELIDWGFAVNGSASVVGSTLIVLIAISFGFNVSLLIGTILYALAYVMIYFEANW
jgi:predicted membrane-bound spermidine synthase